MRQIATTQRPVTPVSTPDSFDNWIAEHRDAIWRIVNAHASGADRDDLLQEIYLQLWRSAERFRGEARSITWVYRVALNTAISFRRRRRPEHDTAEPLEALSSGDPLDPAELLRRFLKALSEVNRATLTLHLEGLDYRQIAEVLGVPPGTVAARLTRIQQQLEREFSGGST